MIQAARMKGAILKSPRPSLVLTALVVVSTALLGTRPTDAFLVVSRPCYYPFRLEVRSPSALQATKKKSGSAAKGFGKVETRTPSKSPSNKTSAAAQELTTLTPWAPQQVEQSQEPSADDSSSDPEERAKNLLREKYGMKSLAEQQMDAKQLELRKEQQKKLSDWKAKAERGEDFDIMSVLPAPVLIAIDRFLKLGLAVCTVAFVTAGILITAEAGSKALESPLPENLDQFIVSTVEPNFTPGLFVLLGFSVSLGIFASLQLGSQGSTYKED